jgi:predicted deacylase
MLSALVHGNELCGAIVLDELLREDLRPRRGRLSLGFMNVAAYQRFDPVRPEASRFVDEDFNRVWDPATLEGRRDSVELRRARLVRPWIDTVDLLLDIHSMQHRTPALTLCGLAPKGRRLARAVGFPGIIVADQGHAAGRRLRDYGAFGDPQSPRNALLVECGQHWERASATVARETTLRFLRESGIFDEDWFAGRLTDEPPPTPRVIEITEAVTVMGEQFRFEAPFRGMEVIPRAGTLLARDGDRAVLTPYDDCVLIMPSKRLQPGQTAVRLGRFVDDT